MLTGAPVSELSVQLRSLLEQGAELVFRAGPLLKGANLCHGTAGNGFVFLKLYELTGHAGWLDRARGFAMHAVEQVETARRKFGQGRYSLWTGDLGSAIYLWQCVTARATMPTWDVF
jgi:hypothetical protein